MTPERRQALTDAYGFVALATDHYFSNQTYREDIALTRELDKQMI